MAHITKENIATVHRAKRGYYVKVYDEELGPYIFCPYMPEEVCNELKSFYQRHWCEKHQRYEDHPHTDKRRIK